MSERVSQLGARHVAAVVIGAIIGVGIFFTPSTLARAVPSAGWVLAIWVIGGIVSIAGALVFADLGTRWPEAGGLYVFLREGFGGRVGSALSFIYGWLQLLVVQPGAMAVIAIVLVDHFVLLAVPEVPPGAGTRSAAACLVIAIFTLTNLVGLRTGGRVQLVMAVLKVGTLVLLVLVGLARAGSHPVPPPTVVAASAGGGGWFSWLVFGLIPVLFTFGGAYHATFLGGSVRDPARTLPRGIVGGVAIVLALYLAVNVAYLALLGYAGLAATSSPAADAIAVALGPRASRLVAGAIVVSAAGILNTVVLGFPFVIYAMAKDGLFFARAARLHPRTGRPVLAVTLQGTLACVAVVVGASRIDVLLTGIAFADATFQAGVALVHLRLPAEAKRYASRPVAFGLFVVQAAVALGCLVRAPGESAYGASALVIGAGVWFLWRRR